MGLGDLPACIARLNPIRLHALRGACAAPAGAATGFWAKEDGGDDKAPDEEEDHGDHEEEGEERPVGAGGRGDGWGVSG